MNKNILFLILIVAILSGCSSEIHVSPNGDDTGKGTKSAPLKTLSAAQKMVRELKKEGLPKGGITVYLHGGTFHLSEPLVLTTEDSGEEGKPITWKAVEGESPIISGGILLRGWVEHGNGIWKVELERKEKLRQLCINDVPAEMAAYDKAVIPIGWRGTFRVTGDEPWAADGAECYAGFAFDAPDIPVIKNPVDLEMKQRHTFSIQRIGVKSIKQENNEKILEFEQPTGTIGERLGWGVGWFAAGMTEILRDLPDDHPQYKSILEGYQKMMAALLKYQGESGLWRQLIDKPEAWEETSSSGMITYAFVTGVKRGWLDEDNYGAAARKAWMALVDNLDENYNLKNVCVGTNKGAKMVGRDLDKQ